MKVAIYHQAKNSYQDESWTVTANYGDIFLTTIQHRMDGLCGQSLSLDSDEDAEHLADMLDNAYRCGLEAGKSQHAGHCSDES